MRPEVNSRYLSLGNVPPAGQGPEVLHSRALAMLRVGLSSGSTASSGGKAF